VQVKVSSGVQTLSTSLVTAHIGEVDGVRGREDHDKVKKEVHEKEQGESRRHAVTP